MNFVTDFTFIDKNSSFSGEALHTGCEWFCYPATSDG